MRVAIVTESFLPQVNGVTNSVLRILETLKQKEHQALVIAPTAPSSHHLGFELRTTSSIPVMQFPVAMPGVAISRALEEFAPDVIHVAAPFLLGAQAISWGKRNGVPTVAVYQTDIAGYLARYNLDFAKPLMEKMVAAIHEGADLNLAPTARSAAYLSGLGIPNVAIWGRGVDLDQFNPAHKENSEVFKLRRLLVPEGELLVGFVGRLAPEKQVHRMQELFDIPGLKFLIVGDGPESENLKAEFASYPVAFAGALSGMDLANAYAALDVFVHFGTEETFGQTIQEAQASALPVVAPNIGGPAELISHGKTGLLVDHTAGSYRSAVTALLDEKLRVELGSNARAAVLGRSWSQNNARLLEHYALLGATVERRQVAELELA